AFAFAAALPPRGADRVYADVLGIGVLAYAPAAGWAIALLAALLLADAARRLKRVQPLRLRSLAAGACAAFLVLPAAAGLALALRHLAGVPYGFEAQRPLLAAFGRYELALALAGLGSALLLAAVPRRADWSAWLGALLVALVVVLAAQAAVPAIAFLPGWPLLLAAGTLWLACLRRADPGPGPRGTLIAAGATLALAQCLYLAHAVLLGVGANLPAAAGLFAWLGAASLFPLLQSTGSRRAGALAGLAALLAAVALAASFRVH
ncbi:MAG: hypothetical protein U1F06_09245, partial [Steroidobacteraceae bacterium]